MVNSLLCESLVYLDVNKEVVKTIKILLIQLSNSMVNNSFMAILLAY